MNQGGRNNSGEDGARESRSFDWRMFIVQALFFVVGFGSLLSSCTGGEGGMDLGLLAMPAFYGIYKEKAWGYTYGLIVCYLAMIAFGFAGSCVIASLGTSFRIGTPVIRQADADGNNAGIFIATFFAVVVVFGWATVILRKKIRELREKARAGAKSKGNP